MFPVPIDSLNKQSNYFPHPSGEPVAQNTLQSGQVSIMASHRNRARNHMFYFQTSCFLLTPHFLMSFYTEKKKKETFLNNLITHLRDRKCHT